MSETKAPLKPKRSLLYKIGKVFLIVIISLVSLVILIALLIQTPPVQNFARKKINAFMSDKLQTRFEIGKVYIGFPKKVVLENVYLEDKQKDTLLSGGSLKVDISMFKLLKNELEINQIELENLTAKVNRVLPDTIYNFQFVIDAFAPKEPQPVSTDTSSMKISVKDINLDKIRLVYKDDITGNDMTLWLEHFETDIKTFDQVAMNFNVPHIELSGVRAQVYQNKPLVTPEPVSKVNAEAAEPFPFNIHLEDILLKDIIVDYRNDVSAMYANLNLQEFLGEIRNVDLANYLIDVNNIELNNTNASVRLGKKEEAKKVVEEVEKEVVAQQQNNWKVSIANFEINNNSIQFDDENAVPVSNGIDYSHIKADALTFHMDDFLFSADSISGKISRGELKEKNGFQLQRFETDFLYAANEAYLKDLIIKTPGTSIQRSVVLHYPSLEAVQKNIGVLRMDIDLDDTRIQVKDILTFAPFLRSQPAFSNPEATWVLNGDVNGSVADLKINELQLQGLRDTRVNIRGTVKGLPDPDKLNGNLVINSLRTSRRDLTSIAPKGSIPQNITIPEIINLRGSLSGNMANARADLTLNSNLGSVGINGTVKNASAPSAAQYNAQIHARDLDLGVIMQNDSMYGPLTAHFVASGRGFDMKTANASLRGEITSVELNRYTYKDIRISGNLARQQASATFNIEDENIHLALNGGADLSKEFPSVTVNAQIDSIKTLPLHFTAELLFYRGTITGNFPVTDPAQLEGELLITESVLITKDQNFKLDSISVAAGKTDTGQYIRVNSEIMHFALTGQYNLPQLGTVFQHAIQPYFTVMPADTMTAVDPYDFHFTGEIINGPIFKVFLPDLQRLDPVSLNGHFSSDAGWNTTIHSPLIIIGANKIQNLDIAAGTGNNAIRFTLDLDQFSSGESMNLYGTNLTAVIADNRINFLLGIKDKASKDKYTLGGLFTQPEPGMYAINLNRDSLRLNYDRWNVAQNNTITLNKGDINIQNFALEKDDQQLRLNSSSQEANSPLHVDFSNFRIGTITGFMKQDTLLADGSINGQVILKDLATRPNFTSDLNISDLTMNEDTLGNLSLKVNNTTPDVFDADITLTGNGNDLAINGTYTLKPQNQSIIDLTADIRRIGLNTIEGATMGAITGAKGYVNGKFDISGTAAEPQVNGNINFNQTAFNLTMIGSYFAIDQERITITPAGIRFDSFTVKDSTGNTLVLDGNALTENFVNYNLDLKLTAKNFSAVNSTKQQNQLFFGKLTFDSDLNIKGTEKAPVVDGSIAITKNTDFTIVLPQQDPGIVEREGIVRFVDMDSIRIDTNMYASYDSLNSSEVKGMEVAVNIEISKEAIFSMIIDEGNGDFVKMRGEAALTAGIDPSGKVNLAGSYEIEEGSYELSFNFLRRRFEIQKGSKIVWLGEPTQADVDLTAVYESNTAALPLVENQLGAASVTQLNRYKQKLPFQVYLKVNGELMKPEITFDIDLPEEENLNVGNDVLENVDIRLTQLRSEPSEMNKQVFALLLLNRFVNENPFESSGGGTDVGTMARQSVSRILTDQLNNLASDLIQGVDINFDLVSAEDYSTGAMRHRSDLNVSVSKQLLNDRLRVTVGSNFELEGPQNSNQQSSNLAGNVAIDYLLSKDGRYMLRGYRTNDYEGVLEGYVIETGINFIITLDYNHFRNLFKKEKKKEQSQGPGKNPPRKDQPVVSPVRSGASNEE